MKGLIRAGIVVAAAAGFLAFLSSVASADVVEPDSALQPASAQLMQSDDASNGTVAAQPKPLEEAFFGAEQEQQADQAAETVAATPAPEQVVGRAPSNPTLQEEPSHSGGSVLDRAVQPLRAGFHQIGANLGRVANACQVGLGSGAGGPVLVLGVLCMAIALERRWGLRARPATDEAVPEFLFAQELTPPG
ncbi:MAG: hypothetical protein WD646_06705 [Actinomycetota bacterium]